MLRASCNSHCGSSSNQEHVLLTRRTFVRAAAAPFALRAAGARPNLLLILTDQQSHNALSAAGNAWLKTPAMDSLAATGVRFGETICPYPVCSPSRSSVFTGRMPHETGVRGNQQAIAAGMPTMGEILRGAGYHTVYGGKWHLPKSFDGMTAFDKLIGGSSQGGDMDGPLAATCAKWLRGKPKDSFLMVASFMNPHDICEWIRQHPGAPDYPEIDRYPPVPGNMAVDPGEPEFIQYHRTAGYDLMSQGVGIAAAWRRDDVRKYLHDYYRLVEDVDRQIGVVLTALRETNLDQKTIVVFASDHGEGMGGHRWVQKASFYEESVRVPLIVSGPGIARRGAVDRHSLASLTDILPTFRDYAGVVAPKDVRGTSLRPALEGRPLSRKFAVSELRYGDERREGRMLRTARHKYVVFNGGARPRQLFDLTVDPGETQNLARSAAAGPVLGECRDLLRGWLAETGDDFVPAGKSST
jgi:arylsulfatase A-like enzyme